MRKSRDSVNSDQGNPLGNTPSSTSSCHQTAGNTNTGAVAPQPRQLQPKQEPRPPPEKTRSKQLHPSARPQVGIESDQTSKSSEDKKTRPFQHHGQSDGRFKEDDDSLSLLKQRQPTDAREERRTLIATNVMKSVFPWMSELPCCDKRIQNLRDIVHRLNPENNSIDAEAIGTLSETWMGDDVNTECAESWVVEEQSVTNRANWIPTDFWPTAIEIPAEIAFTTNLRSEDRRMNLNDDDDSEEDGLSNDDNGTSSRRLLEAAESFPDLSAELRDLLAEE